MPVIQLLEVAPAATEVVKQAAEAVTQVVKQGMSAAQMIINILLIVVSLVMIVSVLLQKGDPEGMAALTGQSGQGSFFGKNKNKTFQGKMAQLTKVSAGVFVVLALAMVFVR